MTKTCKYFSRYVICGRKQEYIPSATTHYHIYIIFWRDAPETILFHLFSSFLLFLFLFFSFFFVIIRRRESRARLWIPIPAPGCTPLFFPPESFFYLELLIYRGHWRGSRRSVKSLNVMRCYYLRGRRLSKSGSKRESSDAYTTLVLYPRHVYTWSSRGRFLGRCRKTRDSTLV